jgi:5-methylcytosine-specific restriction endonuclease McrA
VTVTRAVRRLVLRRADGRCEYCRIRGWPLTVDHVVPVATWRSTIPQQGIGEAHVDHPDNLAAACALCNRAKSDATTARDPRTDTIQPLFNPRRHGWRDHFAWTEDYFEIAGITPIGRATADHLRLNREAYREQRRLLRAAMQSGMPRWP